MSEVKVTNRITITLAGQEIEISQQEAEDLHRQLGVMLGIGRVIMPHNPYSDHYRQWHKDEREAPVRYSDATFDALADRNVEPYTND